MLTPPPEHIKQGDLRTAMEFFLNLLRASGSSEKTILSYKAAIEDFIASTGASTVKDINQSVIVSWINSKLKSAGKDVTKKRKIQVTMHYYSLFVRKWLNWLGFPKEVVPVVKRPSSAEISAMSEEEVEKLFSACRDLTDLLIVSLLFETGVRANELLSITGEDVDIDKGEIVVRNAKYGKERTVFLGEVSSEAVKRRLALLGEEKGRRLVELSYNGLYKRLKSLAKRAGLDKRKIRPHVLRHTFATVAIRRGISLPALQRILGHSDIKVTQVYMHLVKDDLKKEYMEKFTSQDAMKAREVFLEKNKEVVTFNFCPNCGRKVIPGSKFCPYCGHRFHASEEVTA
ncbi:MAG: tyrosine-type recombinase/integrase [Fervidicoccaceae archaeon]